MRNLPFRPNNDITQAYNSGVAKIYSVEDHAAPGYAPQPQPTLKGALRYEEQRLGIQRYYAGRQNQIEIEKVIRVPAGFAITSQDVAVLENGEQYRIDMVQTVSGVYPASLDLSLAVIVQRYHLDPEPESEGEHDLV